MSLRFPWSENERFNSYKIVCQYCIISSYIKKCIDELKICFYQGNFRTVYTRAGGTLDSFKENGKSKENVANNKIGTSKLFIYFLTSISYSNK